MKSPKEGEAEAEGGGGLLSGSYLDESWGIGFGN